MSSREKKFTPGPWEVGKFYQLGMGGIYSIDAGNWKGLAISYETDFSNGEGLANANLIAAASELLEALEKARGDIAGLLDDLHGHKIEDYEGYNYIEAAIAKAYGETP